MPVARHTIMLEIVRGMLSCPSTLTSHLIKQAHDAVEKHWHSYRHPLAKNLLARREKEITDNSLRTGLMFAGLGAGALGLRSAMLSGGEKEKVENFLNMDKLMAQEGNSYGVHRPENFDDAMKAVSRYSILGSDAMKVKYLGIDPTTVIKAVRSTPSVPAQHRWGPEFQQHYDGFKKGPLHGFLRLTDEQAKEQWVDRPDKKWLGQFQPTQKGISGWLAKEVNNLVKQEGGPENYFDRATSLGFSDNGGAPISRERQIEILQKLPEHLKKKYGEGGISSYIPFTDEWTYHKNFKPLMTYYTGHAPEAAVKNYRDNLLTLPLSMHNTLGPVGWAALLGGTGLAGYGGYRWWQHRKRQKEREKRKNQG